MKLSEIFYLNKNDRMVGIWLVAIVACVVGIWALGNNNNDEELASATVQGQVPRSDYYDGQNHRRAKISEPQSQNAALHSFDLNTASPDELIDLGFSEREIHSVMNYRAKGGIYRRVEQMAKISGMTKGEYDRLAPFFHVSDEFRPASDFVTVPQRKRYYSGGNGSYNHDNGSYSHDNGNNNHKGDNPNTTASSSVSADIVGGSSSPSRPQYENNKLKPGEKLPINASDTTALKRIPGVGSYYASQIVRYREKLGGFFSIQQLDDLQNIPADIQDFLSLDPTPLRKIKVNTLSINKLITHPYITFYQAKAIKDYIQKHGPLKSIREMSLNKNFSERDIERLEPYLDYE